MHDYAIFGLGLDQEFVGGEIGSIGQFATAKFPTADVEEREQQDMHGPPRGAGGRLCRRRLPAVARHPPRPTGGGNPELGEIGAD
jgi:hypothetical protein